MEYATLKPELRSIKDLPTATGGILRPNALNKKFRLSRHAPSNELAFYIEHYWIVRWDLRGEMPYKSETLPYPSVHVVIENGRSEVWGVVTGKFTRLIECQGRVFGTKFKPGAFHSFSKWPLSRLTDCRLPISYVFGSEGIRLEQNILAMDDETEMVGVTEKFLSSRHPVRDENIGLINRIADAIIADREITRVDEIVHRFSLNKRFLQRLFNEYVGVGPKWIIRRYRLQEGADQLANGRDMDLTKLALDLGYFDQAHFIKDFKKIVGLSPGEYARSADINL